MLAASDNFGIGKITDRNEICNNCDIPEDISRSIFIALPKTKKSDTHECELHRTIHRKIPIRSTGTIIWKRMFIFVKLE